MGAATASATRSARCKASDFGTSSPRITCSPVIRYESDPYGAAACA